jgi:hypothetical protein
MNDSHVPCSGTPDFLQRNLISACGLYCGSCGIYLATQENDEEKLLQYALVLNQPFDETMCDGCGARRKSANVITTQERLYKTALSDGKCFFFYQ